MHDLDDSLARRFRRAVRGAVAVTLYCQDCGAELAVWNDRAVAEYIESWPPVPLQGCVYDCPCCGSVFRQGSLDLDGFVGWLAFKPVLAA
jgi:hypothetical protein